MKLLLVYEPGCPNCGGPVGEDRLEAGLPCPHCIPNPPSNLPEGFEERVELIGRILASTGRLNGYWYLYTAVKRLKSFEEFFKELVGSRLWSAQRTWAQRLLMGESLALVAPTGVGKTTLLTIYSLYRAREGARIYYLVPTGNLVRQVAGKLVNHAEKVGVDVVAYASTLPKKQQVKALEAVKSGSYDILVTTTGFLSRRWNLLENTRFDVIIVDDVDAMLRNSKNIDRVLELLGLSRSVIEAAYRAVKLRLKALVAKASGNTKLYESLLEELHAAEEKIYREIEGSRPGQLIIATATGRVRGLKPKLFRELLGFDIGRVYDTVRSIANLYIASRDPVAETVKLVSKLVQGYHVSGLVFVSQLLGSKVAKELTKMLENAGVRAAAALSGTRVLDRFASGELDVLIGVASYYGVIVRGLDLPERVYFAVFVEPPAQKLELSKALNSPYRVARLALALGVEGADKLAKRLSRLGPNEVTVLRIALESGEKLEGRLGEVLEMVIELREHVYKAIISRLKSTPVLSLSDAGALVTQVNGRIYYIAPDAPTYVQASGRTSRYYNGGMTHGISIVVTSLPDLLEILAKRLKAYLENIEFKEFANSIIEAEIEKARETRRPKHGKSTSGSGHSSFNVESALIIVESPTKAKTIARFFGKPVARRLGDVVAYETTFYNPVNGRVYVATIASTAGHIYDLTIDDVGVYGVDVGSEHVKPYYVPIKRCLSCGNQFASRSSICPKCGSANVVSKHAIVDALRELAAETDTVYIATDPDTEGEKIGYDLYLLLKPYARRILRIELHEITRNELFHALAKPREVFRPRAYAQVVRRVEDRWIGFSLSRKLWSVFGKHWLGAGRVQTPVLGWIIERYEEWKSGRAYIVLVKIGPLRLRVAFKNVDDAKRAAKHVAEHGLKIRHVHAEIIELNPPPPFTTEALIYEASKRLGYTSEKVMRLAQDLFENGLITYHRTDSTHVSSAGIAIAREYLAGHGLLEAFKPRRWGETGAHEAIRPTRPIDAEQLRRLVAVGDLRTSTPLRESHYRLYDLIFRRFIASQMVEARAKKLTLLLDLGVTTASLTVTVPLEPKGFMHIYRPAGVVEEFSAKTGEVLKPELVRVYRGSTVKLYGHGDVVALMKEKGIGRPSTYARTIQQLKQHGYLVESKYRKLLVPTRLGIEVYTYLSSNYAALVSEERTRQLERKLEAIETGRVNAVDAIVELLDELAVLVEDETVRMAVETVKAKSFA